MSWWFFHDFVTQSLTFEVPIDACERQSGVPELEDDVGAGEQGGKDPSELRHVSRIPRLRRWQWWVQKMRQHRGDVGYSGGV